ncbi:MAG: NUDIX hydrolase [Bacilli bacterium]
MSSIERIGENRGNKGATAPALDHTQTKNAGLHMESWSKTRDRKWGVYGVDEAGKTVRIDAPYQDLYVYHPKFGKMQMGTVCHNGEPLWDQMFLKTGPSNSTAHGMVVVPYYDQQIALVSHVRPAVQENGPWMRELLQGVDEFFTITQPLFWELPRGFAEPNETSAQGAAREILEEIGVSLVPSTIKKLGSVIPDTGWFANSVDVYCAQITDIQDLKHAKLFNCDDLRQLDLSCGLTLASLALFAKNANEAFANVFRHCNQ